MVVFLEGDGGSGRMWLVEGKVALKSGSSGYKTWRLSWKVKVMVQKSCSCGLRVRQWLWKVLVVFEVVSLIEENSRGNALESR